MLMHMRTTIVPEDDLSLEIECIAGEQNMTKKQVIDELLRRGLTSEPPRERPMVLVDASIRIYTNPVSSNVAWQQVRSWLSAPAAWVPQPTDRHIDVIDRISGRRRRFSGVRIIQSAARG